MSVRLNPGQQRVVRDPSGELFVSAGAGTGKTSSLTKRFVAAADELDRVLTITFTEKAADELVERIRQELLGADRIEDARALDTAWVGTIHGFCRRVLTRHALDAGIDPYFGVLDEVASRAVVEECFESEASRLIAEDSDVEALFLAYGQGLIREAVFGTHERIRHFGRTIDEVVPVAPPDAGEVRRTAGELLDRAEELWADANATATLDANRAALAEARDALAAGAGDAQTVGEDALGRAASALAALGSRGSDEVKQGVALGREARALLEGTAAAHAAATHAGALVRLLGAFDDAYARAKAERGMLDFEDLQFEALRLFQAEPEIAAKYREHFAAVMVDEFQDTDTLQLEVVQHVTDANLCTVGDEFQSIYGFRCADVDVFRGRAREVADDGDRARLEVNYRSDPEVLAVVNAIFGSETFFDATFEPLSAGSERTPACPAGELPHVSLVLVDHRSKEHDASGREAEAAALARRLATVIDAGHEPCDIVILLRALTSASTYVEALARHGITAHVEGGGSFFDLDEVVEVRHLLRAIANPLDEAALACVLAGRASALSDDGLYRLARRREGGETLWEVLLRASDIDLDGSDAAEAERIRDALAGLREAAGMLSVSRLARRALRETGLDEGICATGSLADVEKLIRIAEDYERGGAGDLSGFLRHLELSQTHARREPRALEAAPGDAIRVMTVHRAKGLEFPVVAVADLGRPRRRDAFRALVESDDDGVSLALVAPKPGERAGAGERTPALEEMLARHNERADEEADRILYVACTRAERMLILSGAADMQREPGDVRAIDRVRAALGVAEAEPGEQKVEAGGACVRVVVEDADVAVETSPSPASAVVTPDRVSRDAIGSGASREEPAGSPPEGFAAPETVSFSDLDAYRRCPYRWWLTRIARLPEVPSGAEGVDPRALGTAVHAVLQAEGRAGDPGADSVGMRADALVAAVARHERLDDATTGRLREALDRFRRSPLARRVEGCPHVGREVSFAVPLDGDTLLVGSIDVLARDGDRALIVDYKTGAPGTSDQPSPSRSLQAACYALAASNAGATHSEVVFAHVEHDDADLAIVFDAAALGDALEHEVLPLLRGMRAGELEPREAYDHVLCTTCPGFRGLCPRSPGGSIAARGEG